MKKTFLLFSFLLLLNSCGNKKQDKLESFTWLESTLNWARDSSKLKVIIAINITSNFNHVIFGEYKGPTSHYSFYKYSISDSLKDLILHNFHGNLYPEYLKGDTTLPCVYDGYGCSIIYKYINQPERITTYIPCHIPDSIILMTYMLEKIYRKSCVQTHDTFPIKNMINKYRHSIFYYFPRYPQTENDSVINYLPPVIIDSI